MADVFVPVAVSRSLPELPVNFIQKTKVWSSYKSVTSRNLDAAVTHVHFSPVSPHTLAASHGLAVSLLGHTQASVVKTVSSFRDTAYSPHFRHDGRLLVIGSADSRAKVFDVAAKKPLRHLAQHKGAVRTCRFSQDGVRIFTGSDDKTFKVWDLPTGRALFTLSEASDYVRAQCHSPSTRHVWATGSADRKARLYDLRNKKCIFTLDHGDPVDDVHILPGGARAVTVGGPTVKFWDFFTGGSVVAERSYHAKATSCACIDAGQGRLVTGGLDGYVKVHDLDSFETKGAMIFGPQVLSVDFQKDSHLFAAGMVNGKVDVRSTASRAEIISSSGRLSERKERDFEGWGRGFVKDDALTGPRPGSRRYFQRGASVEARPDDVVIPHQTKIKLEKHDIHLKRFQHTEALDAAVETSRPAVLRAVVEELMARGRLYSALYGRDISEVIPMLKIIRRHLHVPDYFKHFSHALNLVLDLYSSQVGINREYDDLLRDILADVSKEVRIRRDMRRLRGNAEVIAWGPYVNK